MSQSSNSPLARDKLKSAVSQFSELTKKFPQKTRQELLKEIELKFDLSPLESEFLQRHLSKDGEKSAS